MNYFHDDQQNAAAIKKRFFLVVDEAYLAEIKNPRTGFCGLNIRDITSFLKTEYPPEPEDQRIVQDMLREEWVYKCGICKMCLSYY